VFIFFFIYIYILVHICTEFIDCFFSFFSETHLPNIKSQLYSPQASAYYKYAGHSLIYSNIEAHASNTIKLDAVLSNPGTYDLAARIEVSVKLINSTEYIAQRGKIESICIINDDNTADHVTVSF